MINYSSTNFIQLQKEVH